MPPIASMTDESRQSLLFNFAGHRNAGGGAPSKDLSEIRNSMMKGEICSYGKEQEEISEGLERIRTIVFNDGLSQRLVDRDDEVEISGLSRDSPWPS